MAKRVFNFSAGPAELPIAVLKQIQNELLDYQGSGKSVMEMSHRSDEYLEIFEQTKKDLRQLMNIPHNYEVLFLAGGGSGQFAAIPLNLLGKNKIANYAITGHWSRRSAQFANKFANVNIAIDDNKYQDIPPIASWKINKEAVYTHICYNETIHGLSFDQTPQTDTNLVADMGSIILAKPIDIKDYALIYACAQKNLGSAGVTIVIVRSDLLEQSQKNTPQIWNYQQQVAMNSMLNTPPTFEVYVVGLMLKYLKKLGGIEVIYTKNKNNATKIYSCIDSSDGFYKSLINKKFRSLTNITFFLPSQKLEHKFISEAQKNGLHNLKGHRVIGGIRVSMYNSATPEKAQAIINFMQHFKAQNT